MSAFDVVRQFERRVAEFSGAKYAVAVSTGTAALFLSLKYRLSCTLHRAGPVVLPAHTFISVPMMVMECGLGVKFVDYSWTGTYPLAPFDIWDGALRFRKGMYQGGLHCISFHARKILNIGEGGMVLTDSKDAYEWISAASYCGRKAPLYRVEDVEMVGWNLYMNPEKAARGLHLMEWVSSEPDQVLEYPDLRKVPLWKTSSIAAESISDGMNLFESTAPQSLSERYKSESIPA